MMTFYLDFLITYNVFCFRIWRVGIMVCLFQLSLARLEIACSPYSFHDRNHLLLSIISYILTPGIPLLESSISTYLYGHCCGPNDQLVVRALYREEMGTSVISFLDLRLFFTGLTLIVNITIGFYYSCRLQRNVVTPWRGPQECRMFKKFIGHTYINFWLRDWIHCPVNVFSCNDDEDIPWKHLL